MHLQVIVLLAVCSNLIKAGPLRHRGAFVLHQQFPRFYNLSAVDPIPSSNIDTSTTLIPSETATPSTISSTDLQSSSVELSPSTGPGKQPADAGSASKDTSGAASSGPATAILTSPSAPSSQSSASTSFLSASNGSPSAALSSTLGINRGANTDQGQLTASRKPTASSSTLDSSSTYSPSASPLTAFSPTASGPAVGSSSESLSTTSSQALSISSGLSKKPSTLSTASSFMPPSSAASQLAAYSQSASAMKWPTAEEGNVAMAKGYSQIFKSLTQSTPCTPENVKNYTVCIDGQPGSCNTDGLYALDSCPPGQSCFATPYLDGRSGIDIGCLPPSIAAEKIAIATTLPTSALNSVASAEKSAATLPTQYRGALSGSTTTSSSQPAVTVAAQAVTVNSDATSGSQHVNLPTQTPVKSSQGLAAFPEAAAASTAASATGAPSLSASSSPASSSPASSSPASSPPASSPPAPSPSAPSPSAPSSPASSSPASSPSAPSPSAPSPTNGGPLVISFPSDIPTSTPLPTQQIAAAPSTPPPAASGPLQQNPGALADLAPGAPEVTSVPSARVAKQIATSIPSATSSPQSSPTSSADGAGITIVPLGAAVNGNGPYTVTVTATTTVHDRSA